MKLNLGCGRDRKEGYLGVDLFAAADRKDDCRDLKTFADGEAEEIMAEHLLEHFDRATASHALAAWRRVLRPGGLLRLEVPDLAWCAQRLAYAVAADNAGQIEWLTKALYGNQSAPGQVHQWGYIEDTLRALLEASGFIGIEIAHVRSHNVMSLAATAFKPGADAEKDEQRA